MVNLDRVDAYEYIDALDFIKNQQPDHPAYNMFKMHGNYIRVYVNGAPLEFTGAEADEVYKILNPPQDADTMD